MRGILTYHSIDSSGSPISVSLETFRRHARWLASNRIRVVPLGDLPQLPTALDAVALTFDDGFVNFASEAAPLLLDHGLPVTLFVVSDHAGRTNAWRGHEEPNIPTLPLLDWDALGRLAERGVTLGAHTRTHPRLSSLSGAAMEDELLGCREEMRRRLGQAPDEFAYPYGDHAPEVVASARGHYSRAVTTDLRALDQAEDPLLLPRLDAWYFRQPGRLEAWGSPGFRRFVWLRAQGRRLRHVLQSAGRSA